MKNTFYKRLLVMLSFLATAMVANAQYTPLKIGATIPEVFWDTSFEVVNAPQKNMTLAADRNKLILLDFWGTWCSACIINFPKMEELQKQYAGQIKIVAVTSQERAVVEQFFASKNGKQYNKILSVVGDKMMRSLFPHTGVPFIVWIKDGKIINTTNAEQVTQKTVKEVLDGEKSTLQTVIQMDRERPLMLAESYDRQRDVAMLNYSIMIKGYIPDIGGGGTFRKTPQGVIYGRQFTNLSLRDIYSAIGYQIFLSNFKDSFSGKRMVFEVKDYLRLKPAVDADGRFIANELYSYEMIVPERDADSLYAYMLKDLSRYTDFTATIEKRTVKCLTLVRTSAKDKIATKGGEVISDFYGMPSILQNVPLWHMTNMLNGNSPVTDLSVIDETGYTGKVDIRMPAVKKLVDLRKELSHYDLDLVEAERTLNMLVIRNKNLSD